MGFYLRCDLILSDIVVYFVDSNLHFIYKNKLFTEPLKDIIVDGMVVSKNKFMEAFVKILKKHKIKSKLFGDEITIIQNVFYSASDLYFLEQIFLDLGFIKVHFFDIRELLPEEDATFIEINQNYLVFYFDNGFILSLDYFKDLPKLFSLLVAYMKPTVILLGTNSNIPKIKHSSLEIYYFANYSTYLIDSLLKVKKCDV